MKIYTDPSISPLEFEKEKRIGLEILGVISKFQSCLIAGGAPRNWVLNNSAKDIDIYIRKSEQKVWEQDAWIRHGLPIPYQLGVLRAINGEPILAVPPESSGSQKGIDSVFQFEYKNKKIQIIVVKQSECVRDSNFELAQYVFRSFDFGINKIAIDYRGSIHKHDDFEHDVKYKKLTMRMDLVVKYNTKSIPARFQKMKKYFPEHEVVIR